MNKNTSARKMNLTLKSTLVAIALFCLLQNTVSQTSYSLSFNANLQSKPMSTESDSPNSSVDEPDSPIPTLLINPSASLRSPLGFPLPPKSTKLSTTVKSSSILPLTSIIPTMSTKKVIIAGVEIEIEVGEKQEKQRASSGAIYRKKDRASLNERDKIDLLKLLSSKQQQLFSSITISINDPEKLVNNHSTSKLLEECDRNISKFDLRGCFTIVVPETLIGPTSGILKEDASGNAITFDLFTDYLRLTTEEVATSSRWYSGFAPESMRMQEDLEWSLCYFEKNVDPSLYSRVHSKLMSFDKASQGGPLLLKLVLDETTTTADSNLKALITIIETYKIKTSCKGEKIPIVVDLFRSIATTVYALNHDKLPSDFVKHYITIFTTSSVSLFNDLFEDLLKQLMASRLQASITKFNLAPTGADLLKNDLATVDFVLEYASRAYNDLYQNGDWDGCINAPPGAASHHTPANPPTTPKRGLTCFNCGKDHHLRDCPIPRDEERISKARTAHPNGTRSQQQPASFQRRTPHKWRPPEASENNKRIIDSFPYTFNPTSNGWDKDSVPPSGMTPPPIQSANVIPPIVAPSPPPTPSSDAVDPAKAGFFAGVNPFGLSYSATPPVATDPYQRKLQLRAAMMALSKEWESLPP